MPVEPVGLRVTLQQLEIFCRVVELRSVTRVAEERHVAQPAVTSHLRSLERRVRAKLIYWDGRQMRLTDAGELAFAWARSVLEETESLGRALAGVRSGSSGSVAVGASITLGNYFLPPILFELRRSIPDVRVVLRVFDPVSTVSDLEEGRLDFALVALDTPPSSARLNWRRIGADELALVGARGTAPTGNLSLDALSKLPFVCAARGQTTRRLIDTQLAECGVRHRRIVMECGTPETIREAAREGVGVSFLSRHVIASDLEAGHLVELSTPGLVVRLPVLLGTHAHRRLSPTQRAVLERIVAKFPATI
jgi:DNA-binding transcriptional LysR family regulator